MVPSTERALSGARPTLLNELNLRQPDKLITLDLGNVIEDCVKDMMMMMRMKKSYLDLSLFEKMNDKAFVREILNSKN
jgi:hypothetical protein